MGVPAFFRWLSRKYASIVVHCNEEKVKEVEGVKIPPDTSKPNPNDVEFDNLYLDMNGIIHPCCHPENKPAPKNEDEMMVAIFEYIDRIFSIVRPRRLLYMAIDGVAPRAKMNQQRSRRFRSSKESYEKVDDIARIKQELREKGFDVPPDKPKGEHFDSNCITPGTPFMFRLADCLRYYIHDRINNDPGWKNIMVILSDANVPGEGEHKIMAFIRKQRGQPNHDPNTHHCLCGADADLIMLGLATHEPHFTIIREEFKPNQPRPCDICGQLGHEMKECQGLPKAKTSTHDQIECPVAAETEFIFIRLSVLRESLTRELQMTNLPFKQDIERAIDDWVFMCFFVGNDFLPHLPSLEIREGAIDRLVRLYKDCVYRTGGYLTDSGVVNMRRAQLVLHELGRVEDEIFKNRRERDLEFRERDKQKRKRARRSNDGPSYMLGGSFAPQIPGRRGDTSNSGAEIRRTAAQMRMEGIARSAALSQPQDVNTANQQAAAQLRAMMNSQDGSEPRKEAEARKRSIEDSEDDEPADEIRLWEDGWKDRYYQSKFDVDSDDVEFRHTVARHYARGLCWVLRYYYQGCASWKWYFPFHYAPFASDFVGIDELSNEFETDTEPFKPLEQLMSVFPAASKQHLPTPWQELMTDPDSPIIDFYPTNFRIDLNGKKYAWQGVALLPFVDERRLKLSLADVYPLLTSDEKKRNTRGSDLLFLGQHHPAFDYLDGLYEGEGGESQRSELPPESTNGVRGQVWQCEHRIQKNGIVPSPLPLCTDLDHNTTTCVQYLDPQYPVGHLHKACMLPGAKLPPPALKPRWMKSDEPYRPQLGFTRDAGYRGNQVDIGPAKRFIRHNQDYRETGRGGFSAGGSGGYRGGRGGYQTGSGGGYGGGGYREGSYREGSRGAAYGQGRGYHNHGGRYQPYPNQGQGPLYREPRPMGGQAPMRGGYGQHGYATENYSRPRPARYPPPPSYGQSGRY